MRREFSGRDPERALREFIALAARSPEVEQILTEAYRVAGRLAKERPADPDRLRLFVKTQLVVVRFAAPEAAVKFLDKLLELLVKRKESFGPEWADPLFREVLSSQYLAAMRLVSESPESVSANITAIAVVDRMELPNATAVHLRQILKAEPDREELRLRLIQVLHAWAHDEEAFLVAREGMERGLSKGRVSRRMAGSFAREALLEGRPQELAAAIHGLEKSGKRASQLRVQLAVLKGELPAPEDLESLEAGGEAASHATLLLRGEVALLRGDLETARECFRACQRDVLFAGQARVGLALATPGDETLVAAALVEAQSRASLGRLSGSLPQAAPRRKAVAAQAQPARCPRGKTVAA